MEKCPEEEQVFQKINQHSVDPEMVLSWAQTETNRTPNNPPNMERGP